MNKLIVVLAFGFLAACSHTPEKVGKSENHSEAKPASQTSIEAKQIAAEQEAPFVTEISFQKGSQQLSTASQEKLNELLERAKKHAPIDQIKAISWADEEYPSDKKKHLSKGQKELADDRNKEIQRFFEGRDKDLKVKTFNMAERPQALAEFMQSESARIKESLETSGIPTTASTGPAAKSKASRAIVMVVPKVDKR